MDPGARSHPETFPGTLHLALKVKVGAMDPGPAWGSGNQQRPFHMKLVSRQEIQWPRKCKRHTFKFPDLQYLEKNGKDTCAA